MSEGWTATTQLADDAVGLTAATALHDLLDRAAPSPRLGDQLPILWHWLAFLPQARQSDIGTDGHPTTGTFLPPTAGQQRMYAGGSISVEGRAHIGETLTRTSRVTGVEQKEGRSGPLMFVTVQHSLDGAEGSISDRNDIVYRTAKMMAAPGAGADDPDDGYSWGRDVEIEPTLLFRFSALTYNAHRIHYDRDYATQVEGYPGLVVHGPLQAMLLADAADRAFPGQTLTQFDFRSTSPAFDHSSLQLRLRETHDGEIELAAFSNGFQTMAATATARPSEAAS